MTAWQKTVDIKQFLRDDDREPADVGRDIANALKAAFPNTYDYDLADLIDEFEGVETGDLEALNYTLDTLYDWADDNKVWLGI